MEVLANKEIGIQEIMKTNTDNAYEHWLAVIAHSQHAIILLGLSLRKENKVVFEEKWNLISHFKFSMRERVYPLQGIN